MSLSLTSSLFLSVLHSFSISLCPHCLSLSLTVSLHPSTLSHSLSKFNLSFSPSHPSLSPCQCLLPFCLSFSLSLTLATFLFLPLISLPLSHSPSFLPLSCTYYQSFPHLSVSRVLLYRPVQTQSHVTEACCSL
ncbi:hypothetical protein NQD34_011277 [Periophthalmus magnuspinnatus]|nr:hypothetical protein NQD34_011277 [Periophthalmus magnuspinnatus]